MRVRGEQCKLYFLNLFLYKDFFLLFVYVVKDNLALY